MPSSIIRAIEDALGRRVFLRKLVSITGAFMGGVLGAPKFAYACNGCCNLCRDPSTCTWNESICDCIWCWTCKMDCHNWKCKECLKVPFTPPCTGPDCKCWTNNHVDACRYCNPSTIPCSKAQDLGYINGCTID
jgi:hypothetical protein